MTPQYSRQLKALITCIYGLHYFAILTLKSLCKPYHYVNVPEIVAQKHTENTRTLMKNNKIFFLKKVAHSC